MGNAPVPPPPPPGSVEGRFGGKSKVRDRCEIWFVYAIYQAVVASGRQKAIFTAHRAKTPDRGQQRVVSFGAAAAASLAAFASQAQLSGSEDVCFFLSLVFFLLPRSSIPRLPDAVCSVWGGLNAHEYRATRMRPLASGGFSAPALLLIRSGSVLCRQAARMSNDKTLML